MLVDRAGHVALCDFGIAMDMHNTTSRYMDTKNAKDTKNRMMSVNYASPERIDPKNLQDKSKVKLGTPVDCWGLGCILYQMACMRIMFYSRDG